MISMLLVIMIILSSTTRQREQAGEEKSQASELHDRGDTDEAAGQIPWSRKNRERPTRRVWFTYNIFNKINILTTFHEDL